MKKNMYTLVRATTEGNTYVSRSFDKLDKNAKEIIRGCIEEDYDGVFEDYDDCVDDYFTSVFNDSQLWLSANNGYSEDFERLGITIWEMEWDGETTFYRLHCSILETPEV